MKCRNNELEGDEDGENEENLVPPGDEFVLLDDEIEEVRQNRIICLALGCGCRCCLRVVCLVNCAYPVIRRRAT